MQMVWPAVLSNDEGDPAWRSKAGKLCRTASGQSQERPHVVVAVGVKCWLGLLRMCLADALSSSD